MSGDILMIGVLSLAFIIGLLFGLKRKRKESSRTHRDVRLADLESER